MQIREQAVFNVCARAQACEKDSQCGGGMCCAVSLWIRSLRMCTPMGQEGDDCHPMSHTVRVDACAPANEALLQHLLPNFRLLSLGSGCTTPVPACPTCPASRWMRGGPSVCPPTSTQTTTSEDTDSFSLSFFFLFLLNKGLFNKAFYFSGHFCYQVQKHSSSWFVLIFIFFLQICCFGLFLIARLSNKVAQAVVCM